MAEGKAGKGQGWIENGGDKDGEGERQRQTVQETPKAWTEKGLLAPEQKGHGQCRTGAGKARTNEGG